MTDFTGQKLGRYLIEEKLGEGGMAVVYRASDERLGRSVAVKVIRVDLFPTASLDAMLKRFDREARALASLTHTNIVGVIDYGEANGSPYLVMEYLPGGSLKDRMGTPMGFAPAARIASVVAGALDYAHARGIIHRDVKPSNILLTATGDPMLSDFGIAKLLDLDEGSTALTSSGMAIGTPEYMAPEQWMGKTGPASDQYALGLILYELVAGRKPYTSTTPGELLLKQATQPLPPPHEFVRDLPGDAEDVILRALAREPGDRYPSMRAFAAALDACAQFNQAKNAAPRPSPAETLNAYGSEGMAGRTPPPYTPAPPETGAPGISPARGQTPPPGARQATPPPYTPPPSAARQATPPPYTPAPPETGAPGISPARGQTPPPGARQAAPPAYTPTPPQAGAPGISPARGQTPPPGGRQATPPPYTPPPAYAPPAQGPAMRSATPVPVVQHPAGYPAAGFAPAAPGRRFPVGLLVGGLLAAMLLVGMVAVGVFLIASGRLPGARGASAPTLAPTLAVVQATAKPARPSPAAPTSAPAVPAAPGGHTGLLRVNLEYSPDTLDPQKASSVNDVAHLIMVYEGLTRLDNRLDTVPGAAERWEYSDDLQKLTFTLRKDAKYSDGSRLNAKRFEYSILRNLDPAMGGDYASITDEITGAREYRSADPAKAGAAEMKRLKGKVGVRALDPSGQPCKDYEQPECLVLQLSFNRPAPYFHTVMSLWIASPVKEELVAKGGEGWWKDPANHVGNGPMVFSGLEADKRVLFKPNSHYWRGTARIDIEYQYVSDFGSAIEAYKNGKFDMIPLSGEDITSIQKDNPDLSKQALIYPGSCSYILAFHNLKPPFDDKAVREAFSYAIDREAMVKEIQMGYASPSRTWIPKGFPGYDPGEMRFQYEPRMAMQFLTDNGYAITSGQLTRDGKTFPITLTYSDTVRNRTRHEWIAARWKADLGLEVKQNPVDADTFNQLGKSLSTAPQTYILGWCADYPDPQNWLSVYWKSDSAFAQRIGFRDTVLDLLLQKADMEKDPTQRLGMYREAQHRLVGDAPGVFLWNNVNAYLVKPYIKGVQTTPQDIGWPGNLDPLAITIEK